MMKLIRLATLIFLCLLGFYLNKLDANDGNLDSLQNIIDNASDTSKSIAYFELGRAMIQNAKYEEAVKVFDVGIQYARENDHTKEMAYLYDYRGIAYDYLGELVTTLSSYDTARMLYQQVGDQDKALNQLQINYGVAYFFAGDLGKSLEHYLEAYEDAQKGGFSDHEAKLVNNIAIIYRRMDKYDEAMEYYRKSILLKKEIGNQKGVANTLMNIGLLFSQKEQLDSAIVYLQKSEKMMKEAGSPQGDIYHAQYALGDLYYNDGQYDKAIPILKYFDDIDYPSMEPLQKIGGKIMLGTMFHNQGKYQTALRYLNECSSFLSDRTDIISKERMLSQRARTFSALGNWKDAFADLDSARQIMDKIKSDERLKLESEMQTKYSTLQKEQEIALLSLEKEAQDLRLAEERLNFLLALLALAIVLIIAFIILRSQRKIKKLNSELNEKNVSIEQALEEKNVLLREIHHRVKNNLQVISSLLGIQSRNLKDKAAIDALNEGRTRVQSMSLIHQNLYQNENLKGIDIQVYFDKLIQNIFNTYNISSGDITLHSEIDPMLLDVDTVVPLGLITNELITNALKYAFPNGQGNLDIRFTKNENALHLEVSDDGIGFKDRDALLNGDSYGYDLIQALVDRLEGSLEIDGNQGSKVKIIFHNYKLAA